jgi:hypothetical protein
LIGCDDPSILGGINLVNQDQERSSLFISPAIQDHRQGVLNATVMLVLYGDYQSTQSAEVYQLIRVIQQQFSASLGEESLCLIFRHFPQIQIHPQAQRAAEAAEAAAAQGQFWQMHNTLFEHQQTLADGYLVEYANDLGLDISQFLQAMSRHIYLDRISQDIESGLQSGVTAAPALFINAMRYVDLWKMEPLLAAISTARH